MSDLYLRHLDGLSISVQFDLGFPDLCFLRCICLFARPVQGANSGAVFEMKRRNDAPGAAEFLKALKALHEPKDPPLYPQVGMLKQKLPAEAHESLLSCVMRCFVRVVVFHVEGCRTPS